MAQIILKMKNNMRDYLIKYLFGTNEFKIASYRYSFNYIFKIVDFVTVLAIFVLVLNFGGIYLMKE